jgi:hypothetical protein
MYDSHDKENNELYREFLNFKKSKQQNNNNNDDDENTPLTKQIKPQKKELIALKTEEDFIKQKKPKTAKQMEQFKIAQEKRKQNIEQKKLQKKIEASKFLLNQNQIQQNEIPQTPNNTPIPKNKIKKTEVIENESSSEEEIIVKTIKKPKKKKRIISVEVSDSESENEKEQPVIIQPRQQSNFRKQQYQKPSSLIKIHNDEPKFYFAD